MTRICKDLAVVDTDIFADVAFGLLSEILVAALRELLRTSTAPSPEFLSDARTVIDAPLRFTAAIDTDPPPVVPVAVALVNVGAVVSKMMSS
jgi:hypothetical protein